MAEEGEHFIAHWLRRCLGGGVEQGEEAVAVLEGGDNEAMAFFGAVAAEGAAYEGLDWVGWPREEAGRDVIGERDAAPLSEESSEERKAFWRR